MANELPSTADLEKALALRTELAELEASLEAKRAEFEATVKADREAIQSKAAELAKLLGQSAPTRRRNRSNGTSKADESAVLNAVPSGKANAIGSADVASSLGVDTSAVASVLKGLEDDGKLKSTGERRGKKYYA